MFMKRFHSEPDHTQIELRSCFGWEQKIFVIKPETIGVIEKKVARLVIPDDLGGKLIRAFTRYACN